MSTPDQRSVTVGNKSAAAMYLDGLKRRISRAEVLRKAGAFTLADAAKSAKGLTGKQLRQRFERDGLTKEVALDPETNRDTAFYFPPGISAPK